jgi:hypothetical protein
MYFLSSQECGSQLWNYWQQFNVGNAMNIILDRKWICYVYQIQSYIATDGQSISKSWCRASTGAHDQIFITLWQLRSCFYGAPSLTRGRVCLLYMLLVLVSVVFLGSESLGTHDHILLTQIWHFPFPRILWLAGSRWRYSNSPPRGCPVMCILHNAKL